MLTVIGNSDDAERLAYFLGCRINHDEADIAIRYGCSNTLEISISVNKPGAIEIAKHKFDTLVKFRDFGLPIPNFSKNANDLNFPVLGRKFYHSCGTDIVFIKNPDNIVPCDYYIEFLPISDEYRYHVVCRQIVSATAKYGGDETAYCRNLKTGWRFKEIKSYEAHPHLPAYAKWATRALGLDFGAVDLIVSNNEPYLLEVNTAPGLIDRRAKLYAKRIKQYVKGGNL